MKKYHLVTLALVFISVTSCKNGDDKSGNGQEQSTVKSETTAAVSEEDGWINQLREDSLNVHVRTLLAASYYSKGQLEKAAYHFLLINKIEPQNLIALSNLGNIYYDSQQDDNAIQFYEKALILDPGNIDMRCDLATCYSRINKLKKAAQILEENIQRDHNHKQSHHNLSVIYRQLGKIPAADKEMKIYESLNAGMK